MALSKFGILGGTFDPIHNGHIMAAESVRKELNLDKVIFIPSGTPPHKRDRKITPAEHRAEMIRIAIEGKEYFSISMIEIERHGYTYTVDTLKQIRKDIGYSAELFFIIGADVVHELLTWRQYEEVFQLCTFTAVMRPGYNKLQFENDIRFLSGSGAKIIPVEAPLTDVSSSRIREYIALNRDVTDMVPEGVKRYIDEKGLYKDA